ncbi:ferrous iron transport protein B [Methanoregula sp.]|uniref:ferrous iron transport protein B n=1 Tax=Methanoregula sp. TaxID=2052170 RepID=UPI002373BD48|nr:ferrous iron transport protein B [Methanoregula sp.]MDD1686480.1 ferrous iron transport protein B [Methanoregula sp.]
MNGCPGCGGNCASHPPMVKKAEYVVALAGNANVGKSVTFNQLTGVDQETGNWPGKTVERAEGILQYRGLRIRVIDLPGIYSISALSTEEQVSREFIAHDHPDVVVNIVDASALERNLFFTLQLVELESPLILAVNQMDLAAQKGIVLDHAKLSGLLGIPVIPMVAIQGKGILELSDAIVEAIHARPRPHLMPFGREVEDRITRIRDLLPAGAGGYPPRWTAIKLLEGDPDTLWEVKKLAPDAVTAAQGFARELEKIHGEQASTILSGERYHVAEQLVSDTVAFRSPGDQEVTLTERIDRVALHPVLGYILLALMLGGLLVWTFIVGAWISEALTAFLSGIAPLRSLATGSVVDILFNGAWTGLVAAVTLIIPYVIPFYLFLALIEDSGFLTRFSLMLDQGMHKMGLHGKAIIPLVLGFGCTVPACLSCRIIESPKQKFLAAFLVTLVPCSARTIVILGIVALFVNIWWALALYLLDFVLIIILGRLAFKLLPGESVGMIMEMPEYHVPHLPGVVGQTWQRTRSLIGIVLPAYIAGSIAITAAYALGLLEPINAALSPITVLLLGLPAITGVVFVFGIIRKEMTILALAALFGTTVFSSVLTPVQLIVFALVAMLYAPCISTILALAHEFGWKRALSITALETGLAIALGAVAFRILSLFM